MNRSLAKNCCNWWAFTLSPPPNYHITPYMLYEDKILQLHKLLSKSCESFMIYPEYQKYTSRLHFHGVIKLKDLIKWHKSTRRQLARMGFVHVKGLLTFEDRFKWAHYIKKEWGISKTLLGIDQPMMKLTHPSTYLNSKLTTLMDIKPILQDQYNTLLDYFQEEHAESWRDAFETIGISSGD